MIQHTRKFIAVFCTLTLMLAGQDAFAGMGGGSIYYGPVAQSIPTLSEAMLVLLAFLFAVVAFRALRAHPGGKPLAMVFALAVLAAVAASGDRLVKEVQAITFSYYFSSPGGGVVTIFGNGEYPILNNSGQPIQVTSVNPNSPVVAAPTSFSPQCIHGSVVQNNSYCYINFALPVQ